MQERDHDLDALLRARITPMAPPDLAARIAAQAQPRARQAQRGGFAASFFADMFTVRQTGLSFAMLALLAVGAGLWAAKPDQSAVDPEAEEIWLAVYMGDDDWS